MEQDGVLAQGTVAKKFSEMESVGADNVLTRVQAQAEGLSARRQWINSNVIRWKFITSVLKAIYFLLIMCVLVVGEKTRQLGSKRNSSNAPFKIVCTF